MFWVWIASLLFVFFGMSTLFVARPYGIRFTNEDDTELRKRVANWFAAKRIEWKRILKIHMVAEMTWFQRIAFNALFGKEGIQLLDGKKLGYC